MVEVMEEDAEDIEIENPLWRPLTGEAKRRRSTDKYLNIMYICFIFTLLPYSSQQPYILKPFSNISSANLSSSIFSQTT